jgi:hypothetical protein
MQSLRLSAVVLALAVLLAAWVLFDRGRIGADCSRRARCDRRVTDHASVRPVSEAHESARSLSPRGPPARSVAGARGMRTRCRESTS